MIYILVASTLAALVVASVLWCARTLELALRQLGINLVDALETREDAGAIPAELLGRLESLERRVTDAVDTTERRYRSLIQRDRRAGILPADLADMAPNPTPSAPAEAPSAVTRLKRKWGERR